MEENLKIKYNGLLERFKKGQELLEKEPENEKYQNTLKQIGEEMENILQAIGEFTEEETTNGFKVEEQKAQIIENKPAIVEVKKENTAIQSYSNNWKLAEKLATSSLLPDEFKGHPENVLIALSMAQKMDIDPFTICQNLHLVKGRLSWSGSFCKTLIEKTGQYKDLDLIYVGKEGTDDRGCYLEATRIRDGKRIKGNTVTVKLAKQEGWWSRKDKYGNETSKWGSMTEQMLGYRAMAFFARLYTPEALNGVLTEGESEDVSIIKEQPQDIL
jgi:hypothetical protein